MDAHIYMPTLIYFLIVGTWSMSFSMVVGSPGSGFLLRSVDLPGPTANYLSTIHSRSSDYSCSVIQESSIDVDSVRLTTPVSQGQNIRYHLGKELCWNPTIIYRLCSRSENQFRILFQVSELRVAFRTHNPEQVIQALLNICDHLGIYRAHYRQ